MKSNKILILLSFSAFLATSILNSYNNRNIELIAQSKFSKTPGFQKLLNSPDHGNDGKYFEMETALYAQETLNESIEGFGLDIMIINNSIPICLDGRTIINLRSTEFDLLTKRFAFESKSTRNPKKYIKIKQFIKERNMLLWFKQIRKDLEEKAFAIFDICFKKKRHPILHIKSPSTLNKNVYLFSTWVTSKTVETALKQWKSIILLLSEKKLRLCFKNNILANESLQKTLNANEFIYYDNVKYIGESLKYVPLTSNAF